MTGKQALNHQWIKDRTKLSNSPKSEEVVASLKKYADAHKFEKAVRHSMATHLTSSELHKLRNNFEELDEDGVGTISIDRLKELLNRQSKEGHNLFEGIDINHFDLDGDGQVDWREFVAAVMEDHDIYNEDNLAKVFMEADTDKNGTLSQAEISKLLGNDHEFTREILETVAQTRGSQAAEIHMTLEEFKKMIVSSTSKDLLAAQTKPARLKTKHRKHATAVSSGQMATAEALEAV